MPPLLKAIAVAIAAVVIVFAGYGIYVMEMQQSSFTGPVPSTFTVNGKTYAFTYAATSRVQWEAGLMNKKITNTTTMLFAFPNFDTWTFWMYDTNSSLDILWLNSTGGTARVVYLVMSAPPCFNAGTCARYTPSSAANFAIEAEAGFAAANGISVGTPVKFG